MHLRIRPIGSMSCIAFVVSIAFPTLAKASDPNECTFQTARILDSFAGKWKFVEKEIEAAQADGKLTYGEGKKINNMEKELAAPTLQAAKALQEKGRGTPVAEFGMDLEKGLIDLDSKDDDDNWNDDIEAIQLISKTIRKLAALCRNHATH